MSDEYQLRKDIDELQRDSARLNNTLDEANVLIDDLKDIDKKFDNYYDSSVIDELLDDLDLDLSSYPTKDELNNILSSYAVSSNYYTKDESDDRFSLKNHTHSQYLTSHQSLSNYIQKSNTVGLVKNDGSIDTNNYLTSHQSLSDYLTEAEINTLLSSYVLSSALNNYYTKTESDNRYRKTSDNVDARDVEYTAVAGQTRLLPSILNDLSSDIGNNTKNITQLTKALDNKSDITHTHNISDVTNLQSNLDNKVDKVTGKGLSSNDYTTTEKNKLAGVETGATKTIIDSALSSTSTNPVQNKVINSALEKKSDIKHTHNAEEINIIYTDFNDGYAKQTDLTEYIDDVIEYVNNQQTQNSTTAKDLSVILTHIDTYYELY